MNSVLLQNCANVAEIATAVVAVVAYVRYIIGYLHRRKVIEDYLRDEHSGKRSQGDKGRRTALHLVGALGMSEEELLKAAFGNKRIKSSTDQDPRTHRAAALYFEYLPPGENQDGSRR